MKMSTEDLKGLAVIYQLSAIDEDILNILTGNELYGLKIVDAFNEVSNGEKTISLGSLYPVLGRLEKQGLISSRLQDGSTLSKGGARRKFFKITKAGSFALTEKQRFRNELHQWKPGYGNTIYA